LTTASTIARVTSIEGEGAGRGGDSPMVPWGDPVKKGGGSPK